MNYERILEAIDGKGIQSFDQGQSSVQQRISIGNGVCRALVIEWLRAKKDNKDFWGANKGTVSEPLLADAKRLEDAVDLQKEYTEAFEDRFLPDSATVIELQKSGLEYKESDLIASAQEGFATELPSDEPTKISTQVLTASSRFFILSISGENGTGAETHESGHSIGIYRPYSLIGKSSDAYLFDPNIGEFKVNGKSNLRSLLIEINQIGYNSIGVNLDDKYILWSFYG